jgi:hypothetical protein
MTATATGIAVPQITDGMSEIEAALALGRAGMYVFPVDHPGLSLCAGIGKGHDPFSPNHQRGKHPCIPWAEKATIKDGVILAHWMNGGFPRNIGIHCGKSGLVVVDEDRLGEFQRYADEHQVTIPPTMVVATAKGHHYYFAAREDHPLGNKEGAFGTYNINIRAGNGFVVGPGSTHETGVVYRITAPVPPTPLPDWVIDAIRAKRQPQPSNTSPNGSTAPARGVDVVPPVIRGPRADSGGERHGVLVAYACSLRSRSIPRGEAETLYRAIWERCEQPPVCTTPLTWDEALAKLDDVYSRYPEGKSAEYQRPSTAEVFGLVGQAPPQHGPPPSNQVGSAPSSPPHTDFWEARESLRHILNFARSRRTGPWALLGCTLVRVVAATTPKIVLPALAGGQVSLNLYCGIVAFTGGGKGTAESASREVITLPHVAVVGPGSGEGIGHLFKGWDNKEKRYVQHRDAVILSAAEVSTLNAMRTRQASTLFPELNKAWMGEPLGFAYVTKEKSLRIDPHTYRLCLITGIQPANANVILEDVDSGTPARYLWMPASDPGAPIVRPSDPGPLRGWTLANSVNPNADPTQLRPMDVCDSARAAVDQAALDRLREVPTDLFNSHALLSMLKTAGALALLENRAGVITEEDWQLAGVVHAVSDFTRQRVIDTLAHAKTESNRVRAEAEAHRAIVVDSKLTEHATQRTGQAIMRKLDGVSGDDGWVSRSELRRFLTSRDRPHFDAAIDALVLSGQVEDRGHAATHQGHQGTEYRSKR